VCALSVIVPVHNAAGHLRACLESLSGSAEACAECIVVDDGSTDSTPDIARQFGV